VVSQLTSGLRVGGAVELGGLDLPPNFARADAMLTKAARFLPGLRTRGARSGWVPPLAPRQPARDRPLPGRPDLICAFGHAI
jgi:D-amino-acid dehydrogenase